MWNSLPSAIVEAPSVKAFERRLDKYWKDQDVLYNFESALRVSNHGHDICLSDSEGDMDIYA